MTGRRHGLWTLHDKRHEHLLVLQFGPVTRFWGCISCLDIRLAHQAVYLLPGTYESEYQLLLA
jgi:hypothetical protein